MRNVLAAMLLGILGTTLYHVGKSMQKQGIAFLVALARTISGSGGFTREDMRRGSVYLSGIMLNNSLVVWIVLANRLAPASYFTSMFGIGLIALLIYARLFLDEPVKIPQYIGAAVLITGTLALGIEGTMRPEVRMTSVDVISVGVAAGIYFGVTLIGIAVSCRIQNVVCIGLSTGLLTGAAASMDPFMKGIAQNHGGSPGYFPSTKTGWVLFMISFLFSTVSFAMSQWGFHKRASASILVSASTSMYVCFPIFMQGLAMPGFRITGFTIAAMMTVICGITLMTCFGLAGINGLDNGRGANIVVPHVVDDSETSG